MKNSLILLKFETHIINALCQHHFGPRYRERDGGYTRILKLQKRRPGDNAPRAVIESVNSHEKNSAFVVLNALRAFLCHLYCPRRYVDRPGELRPAKPPQKKAARDLADLL